MAGCLETGVGRCPAVLAMLVVLGLSVLSLVQPAAARESVIVDYAEAVTPDGFTASFTIDGHPQTRLLRLKNPERIAIDFSETLSAADIEASAGNPMVGEPRHGLVAADRYRVIYHLKGEGHADLSKTDTGTGEILSLVVSKEKQEKLSQAAGSAVRTAGDGGIPFAAAAPAGAPSASAAIRDARGHPQRRLTIVLDPGHGGIDEGAVSKSGTKEKEINLAMGLALKKALSASPNVEVVMTRDDDTFIPLAERAAIARRAKADLFISIHADSIRYSDLRGATVYTLSENASDALSRQIAASENAADRFAGAQWQGDQSDVFDILVDLTRRETVSFSEHFAGSLVGGLAEHDIRLIKRPKRSAGFKVLKAPDVPSVLVELGFLSNPDDEKLLKDEAWRERVADAIASAVVTFFRGEAPLAPSAAR